MKKKKKKKKKERKKEKKRNMGDCSKWYNKLFVITKN